MRKRTAVQLSLCVAGITTLALGTHARAITVDGTLDADYGSALAVQTVNTGFGDNTVSDGTSSGGSELDAGYGVAQGANLYLFFAGNFQNNGNHINIFIDDGQSGGENVLSANTGSGNLGQSNGLTFGSGFNASFAIDANDYQNTLYVDQYSLNNVTASKNTGNYLGSLAVGSGNSSGKLGGITFGINNTNTLGVVGDGGTGTAANQTAAAAVMTGLEIAIPLANLGYPTGSVKVLAAINGGDNYLSNQLLPGLPVGTTNPGNTTAVNLANITGYSPAYMTVPISTQPNGIWYPPVGGSWGTAVNWSNGTVPGVVGDSASFTTASAPSVVTLDGSRTVGSLSFNSVYAYTIAQGAGGSLTIDNGSNGPADITNYGGNHTISAPLILNSNTVVTSQNRGDGLTISGNISGTGSLTSFNLGNSSSLVLSGVNTYTGGTFVDGGNLQLGSNTAFPAGSALTLDAHDLPAGNLDLNGFSATLGSITVTTGTNTMILGAVAQILNTSATPGTSSLVYAGTSANPSNFNGKINDNGASGGASTALVVASGTLTLSGNNSYTGGTSISSGATLNLNSTSDTSLPSSGNVANNGNLQINDGVIAGTISGTGTTSVSTSFALSVASIAQSSLVNNGTVIANGGGTLGSMSGTGTLSLTAGTLALAHSGPASTLGSLSISTGAVLDITNNKLIVNYGTGSSPIGSIQAYILSGLNGGSWNGTGITSSSVALNSSYAIGYADAGDTNDPAGLAPGIIEVLPTLRGDANLDGTVNFSDYQDLLSSFGHTGTSWDQGDFTYDGTTNFSDYQALLSNFGHTDSLSASQLASIESLAAEFGDKAIPNASGTGFTLTAVPEPATLSVLALAGALATTRRRRNR